MQQLLAQARFNEAMAFTVPVTDSLLDSLVAVVEGTKTAEQAFADFLRSIASLLMDAAKQMIAQYIAIGIARMFAGIPASSGGGEAASKAGTIPSLAPSLGGGTLSDPKGLFTPRRFLQAEPLVERLVQVVPTWLANVALSCLFPSAGQHRFKQRHG